MKFLGLAICLGTLVGAAATVRIHLYFDILSFLFVLGGAIGFGHEEQARKSLQNFGQSVYFGWLGTVVGLIAITGTLLSFGVILKRWGQRWPYPCSLCCMAIH